LTERRTTIELDIPDTAEERANRKFCAKLRAIHHEIMSEFNKIDKSREWSYSLKGVTVRYKP
jgi:hypothetical protein